VGRLVQAAVGVASGHFIGIDNLPGLPRLQIARV
jgi:hypothetical protein